MKPQFAIATYVDVGSCNEFRLMASSEILPTKVSPAAIPPQRLWLGMICLFLCALAAKGSSIAIIVTDSQIVIGADGVVTKTTNNVQSHLRSCKIRSERGVFYTIAGSYGIPEINFDAWAIAESAIRQSKTLEGVYDIIQPAILARLPNVVRRTKLVDKLDYDSGFGVRRLFKCPSHRSNSAFQPLPQSISLSTMPGKPSSQ